MLHESKSALDLNVLSGAITRQEIAAKKKPHDEKILSKIKHPPNQSASFNERLSGRKIFREDVQNTETVWYKLKSSEFEIRAPSFSEFPNCSTGFAQSFLHRGMPRVAHRAEEPKRGQGWWGKNAIEKHVLQRIF